MEPVEPIAGLMEALRKHWGFESFRPLQDHVIRSLLAGKDVAVVMPTGGGKSLCYQLPPVVTGRTSVVISPLIALMQDQVAQLTAMGISAAAVHSGLTQVEQREVIFNARRGDYHLLYLSPERLARQDTVQWLRGMPVGLFAIDEAHCISEWGHEFRPEYRQLGRLRQDFPEIPIAAFTASATRVVRHDILRQLQLRVPDTFIRSFYRPNLRYVVKLCDTKTQRILLPRAIRSYSGNVIVYAPTVAEVEDVEAMLNAEGIPAISYHGQMDSALRKRNQEAWMNDEARVMISTIAFGLGINKASVRAVIHLSLPKSVEQYYQEAGRAGRDGEPADCVMLWRKKDAVLLRFFIERLMDQEEQQRAWKRYREIRAFAENEVCRHLQFCTHFGETPKWPACGHCDICGWSPQWLAEGPATPASAPAAEEPLLHYLREWRRLIAKQMNVPAFVVLSDASLADLARKQPSAISELTAVQGIGEYKAEVYGSSILKALADFAGANPGEVMQPQAPGPRPAPARRSAPSSAFTIIPMIEQGMSFAAIAEAKGLKLNTILGYVEGLLESGHLAFKEDWMTGERRMRIEEAARNAGLDRLKPIREALGGDFTYEEIRLVVASLRTAAR